MAMSYEQRQQFKLRAGGPDVMGGAMLLFLRFSTMCSLAAVCFYIGIYSSSWYRAHIYDRDEQQFYLKEGKFSLRNAHNFIILFTAVPLMAATLFGALHEALWINRRLRASASSSSDSVASSPQLSKTASLGRTCSAVLHYKLGPLLQQRAPWITVGEALVALSWLAANICMLVYGTIRRMDRFEAGSGRGTKSEYRLQVVAFQFGVVCMANMTVVLIPVSRSSRLLTGMGVSFERAVLYHKVVGHAALLALLLHAGLYVVYWVLLGGISRAYEESVHWKGGTNIPFGWMTMVFGLPLWITSIATVRKHYYSLFKAVHWLAIPVLVFSCLHDDKVAYFLLGPMIIYAAHVATRLASWQRWRSWQTWPSVRGVLRLFTSASSGKTQTAAASSNKSSDIIPKPHVVTYLAVRGEYIVLSVSVPESFSMRGGAFAYLSCPGTLIGRANEAHAFSVGMRGVPPHYPHDGATSSSAASAPCCTFYIKKLGGWTDALAKLSAGVELSGDPSSLLVDMDGPYNQSGVAFTSHAALGAERVVLVAGGSGLASFLCFLQDWSLAAAAAGDEGRLLPEVHLVWTTRSMQEMELLGAALPTFLAQAGELGSRKLSLTLHCTAKNLAKEEQTLMRAEAGGSSSLLVEWPAAATGATGRSPVAQASYVPALLDVMRTAFALSGGYVGVMFANYEEENRGGLRGYHRGGLMVALTASWAIAFLVFWELVWTLILRPCFCPRRQTSAAARSSGASVADADDAAVSMTAPSNGSGLRHDEETKMARQDEETKAMGPDDDKFKQHEPFAKSTAPVQPGRPDVWELLRAEKRLAEGEGRLRVRVLASGPDAMVKECVRAARDIDWRLFAVEEFSFEF